MIQEVSSEGINLKKDPFMVKAKALSKAVEHSRQGLASGDTLNLGNTLNTQTKIDQQVDTILDQFRDFFKHFGRLPKPGEVDIQG